MTPSRDSLQNLPSGSFEVIPNGRGEDTIVRDYVDKGNYTVLPSANRDQHDGRPLRGFNPSQQIAQIIMDPSSGQSPYIWDPGKGKRHEFSSFSQAEKILQDLNKPPEEYRPTGVYGSAPGPSLQEQHKSAAQETQPTQTEPQIPQTTQPTMSPQPSKKTVKVTIGIPGFGKLSSSVREAIVDTDKKLVVIVLDTTDFNQSFPDLEPTQPGQAILLEIEDHQSAVEYFGWRYQTGDGLDHLVFMIAPPQNP